MAARVVNDVMSRPMSTSVGVIPVSLSSGAAPLVSSEALDQAIGAADRAMYAAKASGTGQLVLAAAAPE